MAGWKKNNKNELEKLNDYSKTDITNAEIPVVIPAEGKNARFKVTDLAPIYKDDEDNCLKIENGVISKTDTTYQSGDNVIKVNNVGDENIISCEGFGGKKYVSGTALQVTENTTNRTTTFSTLKSTDDKLMGNIPSHQKHQPTYRKSNQTQFSGFSNLYGIIADPWWSEATPNSFTLLTRITGGRIHCYNDQLQEKTYYINGDTSTGALYKFNQYAIHMARVGGIYIDYDFLTNHINRELYISRTYTAFDANNATNLGSKFYITENSGSSRRLRVIIYSCGYICEGYSTANNPEICLQDICYWNWASGQNGSNFNYMIRPVKTSYHLRDYGYNGVDNSITNDGGAHYFISTSIPQLDKYYDSNNVPCTVLPDSWTELDYTWTWMGEAVGWIPSPIMSTAVTYYANKNITQYSNFYKTTDQRYHYWETATKIRTLYYYNSDLPAITLRDPNNIYYYKYSHFVHEGEVHRDFNQVCPESHDEYFSSFKFMVNGYGITTVNGVDYDTVYLVDMRN